eukprot:2982087-Prymnesium_polylepis.1
MVSRAKCASGMSRDWISCGAHHTPGRFGARFRASPSGVATCASASGARAPLWHTVVELDRGEKAAHGAATNWQWHGEGVWAVADVE